MRQWINLVENYNAPRVQSWQDLCDDNFCEAVQQYIARNLGDWVNDYATDEFDGMVADMLRCIWDFAVGSGARVLIYRAELRPKDEAEAKDFGSVGQFWSWTTHGAQVCHHDNGYEEHGTRDLANVMFEGTVDANDVNWVATVAKNFILKNEREITVKADSLVAVERVFIEGMDWALGQRLPVRSNGHEDDF